MRNKQFFTGNMVFKLDGSEFTKEDLKILYITDQLSVATIAYLFDASEIEIAFLLSKHGVLNRKLDIYVFAALREHLEKNKIAHYLKVDQELEQEEIAILNARRSEIERDKGYINPKNEIIVVNGRKMIDKQAISEYEEKINTEAITVVTKPIKSDYTEVRSVDLSAMRLHRGLDMMQFASKSKIPYRVIKYYEKTKNVLVPKDISFLYFTVLRISRSEFIKIRECLAGERRDMYEEEKRSIPEPVRQYVYDRDLGKCTECGRKEYLHYHHKERFSEGGKHQARNIVLLCVGCHALEHYGEKSFHMLKARAEKLGVFLNVG